MKGRNAIPCVMFASLGAFGWRVRGSCCYGAVPGSTFAALGWATAWLLLSRLLGDAERRRFASGWSVLALGVGIGVGGMHGWMQYSSWVAGVFPGSGSPGGLALNPAWGYAYWALTASAWCGLGPALLAWTDAADGPSAREWVARVVFGACGGIVAILLRAAHPGLFVPGYGVLDFSDPSCTGCDDALEDTFTAVAFFGVYAGLLACEAFSRRWTAVKLGAIPGAVAAAGWCLLQALIFDVRVPGNFVRDIYEVGRWGAWEMMAGVPFGLGLGLAFWACNRPDPAWKPERGSGRPNLNAEVLFGVYLGVAAGLAFVFHSGVITAHFVATGTRLDQAYALASPFFLVLLVAFLARAATLRRHPYEPGDGRDHLAEFPVLFAAVYAVQRALGFVAAAADPRWVLPYALLTCVDVACVWWAWKVGTGAEAGAGAGATSKEGSNF